LQSVTAIVPAAGLSRRFGGPNKLLQPWGQTTIVGAVVSTLAAFGLPVIVVTGRDPELVAATCPGATTVFNDRFEEGLGTSIACGARVVPDGHAILVALGDMPGLRADVLRTLLEADREGSSIFAPVYESEPERPGHPVLFGSGYREALAGLNGDDGARSIIQANRSHLRLFPVSGVLADIDEPNAC
jgi:molybdenum cofactor cytidylyltransferase